MWRHVTMVAKFLDLNNLSWQRRPFALSNDKRKVWATVLFLTVIMYRKVIHDRVTAWAVKQIQALAWSLKTDLKSGFLKINPLRWARDFRNRSVLYFRPWSEYYLSTRLPWFSIFPFVSLLWLFTVVLIEWNHDCFFSCRWALDYAYACKLSGPLVKGDIRHFAHKHTARIIQSVKQGIQAGKRTSLLQSKRTNSTPSTRDGNVNLRKKGRKGKAVSKMLGDGAETAKGATGKRKKRKRPQHLSLLDEQGKRDLFKRCRTILDDNWDKLKLQRWY